MTTSLTGAEKSRLRGRGQLLDPMLKIGREGVSPTVIRQLVVLLASHDLVKVRFTAADRGERTSLQDALAGATESACVGSVGATALFYRASKKPPTSSTSSTS